MNEKPIDRLISRQKCIHGVSGAINRSDVVKGHRLIVPAARDASNRSKRDDDQDRERIVGGSRYVASLPRKRLTHVIVNR